MTKILSIRGKSDNAHLTFLVNGLPVPIIKNNADYLVQLDVSNVLSREHNASVTVICNRGEASIGTIDTNYCQDINSLLAVDEKRQVWADRAENRLSIVDAPYEFYSNFDEQGFLKTKATTADERFNIQLQDKEFNIYSKPKNDPEFENHCGWEYCLMPSDVLQFQYNVFRPQDYLSFIIEQNLGDNYFDDEKVIPFAL